MIESAEIKNFRCFEHVKLQNCKSVNVVLGGNGAGKTSLLEALFLSAGNSPELSNRLRLLRGFPDTLAGELNDIADSIWLDFFRDRNKKAPISIHTSGSFYRNRLLTIKYEKEDSEREYNIKKPSEQTGVAPVIFEWIGPKGMRIHSRPELRDGKILMKGGSSLPEEAFFLSAGHMVSAGETAKRFSEISKRSEMEPVLSRLRLHFPEIEDLSIELIAGNPMVCAKTQRSAERTPLNLLSSGLTRIAHIMFTLYSRKGSVLLIDEIENGIYFQKLPSLWDSLLDFCKQTESQVFVSTHSWECIKAALPTVVANPNDFSVIHTDNKGSVFQYEGARFASVIDSGFEIR